MNRYRLTWLTFVLGLPVLLHSGCQEQARPPGQSKDTTPAGEKLGAGKAQADQRAPKITFENTVYDFGEIGAEKKYTGQFTFSNTGNAPLRISDVKKCCGAVVKLDKEDLSPGESAMLKVEYTTGRGAGVLMRQLHVNSNDPIEPDVTLTIKARIVPKVDYEPKTISLVLNKENGGCPQITLTGLDNKPFAITGFQSNGESITAEFDPSVEATKFVIQPKVDLEKLQKRSAGFIAIGLTHPELDKVTIYFSTKVRFQSTPASIILFNPPPQKPTVKKISIVSNYGENFEVESTSSQNGFARVLSQKEIPNGCEFEVEVTPPPLDGTGQFTDVLNVQLKGGEKLAIKCYGRYTEN